ncbi:MAG: MarR family transcriptional regulator [Actinomycetota bacterium]|nr:MarR family transcriptional regulator [Actinomycetota bacterium]
MTGSTKELDTQLVARLRLAVSRLARRLRQEAETGISPSMLSALASIERLGPCTLGDLAAHEQVQPPTVTRVVARLHEEGLLDRIPDPVDRRIIRVQLSAAGKAFLQRVRTRKNEFLARRLRDLDASELQAIETAVTALEKLLADRS